LILAISIINSVNDETFISEIFVGAFNTFSTMTVPESESY
jgi:hypothetical protein